MTQCFEGRRYLERLEWELKQDAKQVTWVHLPACRKLSIHSNYALTPHAAAYGFRGRHPSVYQQDFRAPLFPFFGAGHKKETEIFEKP
jgi:hypothetical protein